jgi:hypothetical protein
MFLRMKTILLIPLAGLATLAAAAQDPRERPLAGACPNLSAENDRRVFRELTY